MTQLELGPYRLEVPEGFGPRITGLWHGESDNLLARLADDVVIDHPAGPYVFHGGHRVWASPEVPEVTWAPDDHRCEVSFDGKRLVVSGPEDAGGLLKRLEVTYDGEWLHVENWLAAGDRAIEAAPWAITQFPLGGTAIVDLRRRSAPPLPDRVIALWPYTRLDDERFSFRPEALWVEARDGDQTKIAVGPGPMSLGYLLDGWLFVKSSAWRGGGRAPDFGAVGQVYVGNGFCELECVGELTALEPGESATLSERWAVIRCDDLEEATEIVSGWLG